MRAVVFFYFLTHAVVSSVDLHVLRRTHAGVVAQRVVAGAGSTDANVGSALINVCSLRYGAMSFKIRAGSRGSEYRMLFLGVIHRLHLTLTDASLLVEIVSCRTLTLETAKGVDAVPTLAETRQLLALINI